MITFQIEIRTPNRSSTYLKLLHGEFHPILIAALDQHIQCIGVVLALAAQWLLTDGLLDGLLQCISSPDALLGGKSHDIIHVRYILVCTNTENTDQFYSLWQTFQSNTFKRIIQSYIALLIYISN